MLKSNKLLTEDLYTIDWNQFNCQAILDEVTEQFKIVCEIQPEHPHTVAPKQGDCLDGCSENLPKQIKEEKSGREEWDNMIGI